MRLQIWPLFSKLLSKVTQTVLKQATAVGHRQHGAESRDLNDRVHGILCRYSDKTSKQNLSHCS